MAEGHKSLRHAFRGCCGTGHNDAYLINAADLTHLDANDGITDGLIHLATIAAKERP